MITFKDEWEATLDELEIESANLLVCSFLLLFSQKLMQTFIYYSKKNLQTYILFLFLSQRSNLMVLELNFQNCTK